MPSVDVAHASRIARLSELPAPPSGRHGWPWTTGSEPLPPTMADGRPWPSISIVTACLNAARFIEESIRSVLLQGYPNVDYVIVDGGSRDGTVDVIRKYAPWLGAWVSEPDRNTSHALNKGFALARGELVNATASDDLFLPGALRRLAEAHAAAPGAVVLAAIEMFDDETGASSVKPAFNVTLRNAVHPRGDDWFWHSGGLMVPRAVHDAAGPFDERPRYCNDQDWICRLLLLAPVVYVDDVVVRHRVHPAAATAVHPALVFRDYVDTVRRFWHHLPDLDPRYLRAEYFVREAAIHLAHHPRWAAYWNRAAGLRLLGRAVLADPRIVAFPLFRSLLRRTATPWRWMRSRP
jgi:glycosyltransferase involved in cell wall biosynthesis